jgi:hypothetical protein
MNRNGCEREFEVVEALRKWSFSEELRGHVRSCAICAETLPVAQMLLLTASALREEHEPPAAGLVWRRAQVRRQEIALQRATRPLIFIRVLSVVYAVLSGTWLLHYFLRSGSMERISGWNVMPSETAWLGAAIAVLAIVVGALYLLHDGRRSGIRVPSI